jgi:glucose-6-phosphate 1-dehydrogenase
MSKPNTSTTFVIFGATGDLATTKLFPALFDFFQSGELNGSFRILGTSRRRWSDDDFRHFIRNELGEAEKKQLHQFLQCLHFQPGDVTDIAAYDDIYQRVEAFDKQSGVCANKLFYLAMSPTFFAEIGRNFSESKLMTLCNDEDSWIRLLVEKPYGTDLQSAQEIDQVLCGIFTSDQLFRIDHYLAKPALRNILALRFYNQLFAGSWNKQYINHVLIRMAERSVVDDRAGFYDHIGAFRDVGQNHLLQILAAVAMEPPVNLSADSVRSKRADVLADLRTYEASEVSDNVLFGQYDTYTETEDVAPSSQTPTYFLVQAYIDNKRWQGVPFYLESGKGLNESQVTVDIQFGESQYESGPNTGNTLRIELQPNQELSFSIWTQKPELSSGLKEEVAEFSYENTDQFPSAYEAILYHAIAGDQLMFAHNREVEASWQFAMPIIRSADKIKNQSYPIGSAGPKMRDSLLPDSLTDNL